MVQGPLGGRTKLYLSILAVDLVAFACGMTLAWSSPVLQKLKSNDNENPLPEPITSTQSSWIGSLLALSASIGPFPFAFLQDKIGRKYTLLLIAIPFIVSYFIAAFAKHVWLFLFLRVLAGLSVGGIFTVLPTYIAEISEHSVRGMLGTSMNNLLCAGLVVSYSLGAYMPIMWFNIVLAIFPAAFMVIFFVFIPDSPYFLVRKSRDEAEAALIFLRSKNVSEIQSELKEIEKTVEQDRQNPGTFLDIFKLKGTTKALIISVMLCVFQQLSGINIILFYAQDIFENSGSTLPSAVPPIIIGAVQLISSFISPIAVDKLGRKILLMASAIGMTIFEVPLGVYFNLKNNGKDVEAINFLPILTLVGFIITYNSGFGPLPWTIMAELFPSNIKSAATSFSACICWFFCFILTYFFASVSEAIGMDSSFWIFSGCNVIAFLFVLIYVPETKGKSFQDIQNILNE